MGCAVGRESPFSADVACDIRLEFLSDSIVLACEAKSARGTTNSDKDRDTLNLASLFRVIDGTAYIAAKLAMADPKPNLVVRGAIAWGEFLIESPFIIGPAVDEAANAERDLDAAVVEVCPSALSVCDASVRVQAAAA